MLTDGYVTGAYGLRIEGLGAQETLRLSGGADWPLVRVRCVPGEREGSRTEVGPESAVFQLLDAELHLDRVRQEAVYRTEREFSLEEIVHPYMAPVATVFARWHGREALHAGAFAAGDGAWALLGDKQAGKSSTLAWLAQQGVDVLADDIVVLDGGRALAGPRCLDVRDDTSHHLDSGEPTAAPPREGGRYRMVLPPLHPEVPLRGVVYLEWGERTGVERVTASERIDRLNAQRQAARLHNDPVELLELAALPALVLTRPRGLGTLAAAGEALLAATAV